MHTLSLQNKAEFHCPIFAADTRVAACTRLRELVWAGRRPAVRRGCQACMSAGKCPAAVIVSRLAFGSEPDQTYYGREEPGVIKLHADVLERVLPVVVMDSTLQSFGVPQAERDLIASSNARIAAQLDKAPTSARSQKRAKIDTTTSAVRVSRSSAPVEKSPESDLAAAARSGDLAAAINANTESHA